MKKILFVASQTVLTPRQEDMFRLQYGSHINGCHHEDAQGYEGTEIATMIGFDTESAKLALVQVKALALEIVKEATKVGATHLYCSFEDVRLQMWTYLYGYAQLGYPTKGDNQYAPDWTSLAEELSPMMCVTWLSSMEYWVKAL